MTLENKVKNKNVIEVPDDTDDLFKKITVKLGRFYNFDLPRAIVNYYDIEVGDVLCCELVEIESKNGKRPIEGEVLIDIGSDGDMYGAFQSFIPDRYNFEYYQVLTMNIKKIVKSS